MPEVEESPGSTPEQRTQRARMAAFASWKATPDRTARTAEARRTFQDGLRDRLRDELDPKRKLPAAALEQMVQAGVQEHYARLAFLTSKSQAKAARKAPEASGARRKKGGGANA